LKLSLFHSKDFWGGVMLLATGVAAMALARDYPFGTSLRMGPGYFPMVLGGVLAVFGVLLALRGLRSAERIEPGWSLRALIVLPLAFVAFGLLMDYAGFVPALAVLVIGSAAASAEFKFSEVALLTLFMLALCVGVFIFGLGLPYRLFGGA
jgi:hypothetical protein